MSAPTRTHAEGPPLDPRIADLSGATLVELLERAAARTPRSVALVIRRGMAEERWSYQVLAERSTQVAGTLQRSGVRHGDRVLTWSQNDPWLVAAYFATWRLGAIIVPLDLRMQTDVAVRIGARTRPSLLLAGPEVPPEAAAALGVPVVSVSAEGLQPGGSGPNDTTGPDEAARPDPSPTHVAPDTIAEILFTSGTTSDPKGVVLTHGQIVHTARAISQTGMGTSPERGLGIIPLSHMYGQSVPLLMGLMSGSTLVFLHALTPKAIGSTMRRERITAVTLVPQIMDVLMQGIESEARHSGRAAGLRRARRMAPWLPFELRRLLFRSVHNALGGELRVISSGGARLGEEQQQAWESMGVRVIQGYGTTECAAITGHSRTDRRPGTVGPPLAGIEVVIAADGELLARGPNVMSGYWEADAATAEVLDAGGWFHTGDAATVDERGQIVILGRTRDRISLPNGLNVYPEDVESALNLAEAIKASVVFEAPPGRLAAAIVPDGGADDPALGVAVREANARLAPHQRVVTWRRWPEEDFPRTHTLKVRRAPVEAWFTEAEREPRASGQPSGEAAAASVASPSTSLPWRSGDVLTIEALIEVVRGALAETRSDEPSAIGPETTLASLELDSLGTVTLGMRIDDAFDASLSEIASVADIRSLYELVTSRLDRPPAPEPSRWAFSRPARAVRRILDATLMGWTVRLVARPRVEGLDHLRGLDGPVLICPNHASHLDTPTVRYALPAHLRDRCAIAAAADFWFQGNPAGSVVALLLGALPFARTSDVRASLDHVGDLVNDGWSVMIFPEGTRSRDGRMGPMRNGIGLLATSLHVPVLPVHIEGTWQILPPGQTLPSLRRRKGVRIRFGQPLLIDPSMGIQAATEAIGSAIAALATDAAARRPNR